MNADFVVVLNDFFENDISFEVPLLDGWLFPLKSQLNGNKLFLFGLVSQDPNLPVDGSKRFVLDFLDWEVLGVQVDVLLALAGRLSRDDQVPVVFLLEDFAQLGMGE